jgi:hypothetical protein
VSRKLDKNAFNYKLSTNISMGKVSKSFLLFLVFVFTISKLITFIPIVAGEFTYGGPSNLNNPPSFKFSLENGTVLYNVGTNNIAFSVAVGAPYNTQTLGSALYLVYYKASWQDKPKVLHQWSMNNPADMNDDDPNPKAYLFHAIDLTDVPEGSHQIEIIVDGGGYVFGGGEYYTFSATGSASFHFSIVAPPSPPAPSAPSSAWGIQTIDVRGAGAYIFNSPLVALDSNDMPHIVYSKFIDWPNSFTRFVMYKSWNGLCWSTQAISEGTPYSFILDDNDTPHLVYGCIEYATFNGTNWVTQIIENVGDNFGAVALDSSGKPHVAYNNGNTVKYASQTGSSWDIQTVESLNPEYNVPFQVSIALDQKDTIYILYGYPSSYEDKSTSMSYSTTTIRLAVCKNSRWSIETIPLPPPINGYGNMVLDSKGYPHFICSQMQLPYTYPGYSNLLYVSWDGTAWNTQDVVSNITLEIYGHNVNWVNMGFLALDVHDYPRISYFDTHLMYASWNGNTWKIQTIDTNAQAKPAFLALDSNDNPHISYLGPLSPNVYLYRTYANVTYATSTEATGTVESGVLPLLVVVSATIVLVVIVISLLLYRRHLKATIISK